jgi:uncharacterized protein with HEPN domain
MPREVDREREIGYLVDMLENARCAVKYVAGKDRAAFDADIVLQNAVMRWLGIVGEAASRITDQTRAEISEIPWRTVIAMRNILVHDYGRVSLDTTWEVTQRHAPEMIEILLRYLDSIGVRPPPSS